MGKRPLLTLIVNYQIRFSVEFSRIFPRNPGKVTRESEWAETCSKYLVNISILYNSTEINMLNIC